MGRKRRNWQPLDGFGAGDDEFDDDDELDEFDDDFGDDFDAAPERVAGAADPDLKVVRLDAWLWAAHLYKTKDLAAEACSESQVKVNEVYARATKMVSVGDVVSAFTVAGRRQYEIIGLAEVRGSTSASETLYEDTTPADWNARPSSTTEDYMDDDGGKKGKKGRKRDRRAQRKMKYR